MKGAQKGIEMKLIQILALATAMATVATAQNSGANSQPTPSPTPAAAGKTAAGKTAGTKKPADLRPPAFMSYAPITPPDHESGGPSRAWTGTPRGTPSQAARRDQRTEVIALRFCDQACSFEPSAVGRSLP